MKVSVVLLGVLCLLTATAVLFVWSGVYNVAASAAHWPITERFLEAARGRSIAAHSRGIMVPPSVDPKVVDAGFRHYHAMCRLCHNAPGYPRTEISLGLYPVPPDFTAKDMKLPGDAEIFWIVRNGIKMTGMPAFGATHSEEELWGIVFFAKRVQTMKSEEYSAMDKPVGPPKETGHHH